MGHDESWWWMNDWRVGQTGSYLVPLWLLGIRNKRGVQRKRRRRRRSENPLVKLPEELTHSSKVSVSH